MAVSRLARQFVAVCVGNTNFCGIFFHALHFLVVAYRDPFSKSSLFEHAVKSLLKPLVRALIAQGVTAPALYRIVKRTYVEVAAEELADKATDSQISVMTGVHRRDVKTFRTASSDDAPEVSRKASMLATVVGRWVTDPDMTDDQDVPLELPRSSDRGPSFDQLVQRVSSDVRPRAVLEELVRQGLAKVGDAGVSLNPDALVGSADLDQKMHFFSHNLSDHLNAAVDNLLQDPSPFMERAVFYNALKPESVDQIEAEARRLGQSALQDINQMSARLQNTDKAQDAASHRFRFGVFFYREDDRESDPSDERESDTK